MKHGQWVYFTEDSNSNCPVQFRVTTGGRKCGALPDFYTTLLIDSLKLRPLPSGVSYDPHKGILTIAYHDGDKILILHDKICLDMSGYILISIPIMALTSTTFDDLYKITLLRLNVKLTNFEDSLAMYVACEESGLTSDKTPQQ